MYSRVKMKVNEEFIKYYSNRKIYVLKDELGNTSTGRTYNEALDYLTLRRKTTKERKR